MPPAGLHPAASYPGNILIIANFARPSDWEKPPAPAADSREAAVSCNTICQARCEEILLFLDHILTSSSGIYAYKYVPPPPLTCFDDID